MAVTLTYDPQLSRVRIAADALGDANYVHVERSTDGVRWSTVRGGVALPVSSGQARLDDFEFAPNVPNIYRVTPSVSEMFESPSLAVTITDGGSDAPWARDDSTAHTGRWSLRSGAITHEQHSDAVITVPAGATTLTLWWRISSESAFDFGRIVTDTGNVLTNPGFEAGLAPWGVAGGTAVQSSAQAHSGTYAAEITPDGTSTQCYIESEMVPVSPGQDVGVSGWMWCTEAASEASVTINWYDASGTYMSSDHTPTAVSAGTWTQLTHSATAPEGAAEVSVLMRLGDTPPASNVVYADDVFLAIANEVVSASGELDWTAVSDVDVTDASTVTVRYDKDGVVSSGADAAWIDDLVFGGYTTQEASITPVLNGVWLKNVARPYLNARIQPVGNQTVTRPARNGVFDVVGRRAPIAVTDIRGSRRFPLSVMVDTEEQRDAVEYLLDTGEPLFLHVPPGTPLRRSAYVVVEETEFDDIMGLYTLPMVEVAAPGPEVVGATITYENVRAAWATYADVLAAEATYEAILERIGSPADVITP